MPTSVHDDDDVSSVKSDVSSNGASKMVDSPVLCYLSCMIGRRPKSLLQSILCSFYSEDDLENAKMQLLSDFDEENLKELQSSVKAKHKPGIRKKTLDSGDLLAMFEHLSNSKWLDSFPTYVTKDIFHIPSDDPLCEDPKVLQCEFKKLRKELQELSSFVNEKLGASTGGKEQAPEQRQTVIKQTEDRDPSADSQMQPQVSPKASPPRIQKSTNKPMLSLSAASKHGMIRTENHLFFFGRVSMLSNFHTSPLLLDSRRFPTSEHAFQYLRATLAGRSTLAEFIAAANDPREAKKWGDTVKPRQELHAIWEDSLVEAMKSACKKKFQQNGLAREYLLNTGNIKLVEASVDQFWGCGVALGDPSLDDMNKWKGKNMLGRILMQVRSELSADAESYNLNLNEDESQACAKPSTSDYLQHKFPGLEVKSESQQRNYASVLKQPGQWNLVKTLKKRNIQKTLGSNDNVALKGVERKNYVEFYAGQLEETTTKDDFEKFLKTNNITVKHCYALQSKVGGTSAFRFRCDAEFKDQVLNSQLWPCHTIVRPWIRKPRVV